MAMAMHVPTTTSLRPLAYFPPTLWGSTFASFSFPQSEFEKYTQQVEVLKEDVKLRLMASANDPIENIVFIDLLCRLGMSYHFEEVIEDQLALIFSALPALLQHNDHYNLSITSTLFRVLRQHGYNMPSDFTYDFCTLTSHPYDPTCHIVYFREKENALMFCQPGDKEFTVKKWDYEFFPTRVHAVVAGEIFFYLPNDDTEGIFAVVIVEFKESTYRFNVVEMDCGTRYVFLEETFFFEYSGELFVVYQINHSARLENLIGFEILKADFLNKKCVSVKNLGALAVFIGYGTAHVQCASVESGIKANSVYFFQEDDLDSYSIYNLEEGTIRLKPTFSSVEMEATDYTRLNWIMMHCDASLAKLLKVSEFQGDQESTFQDSEKEKKASGEVEEVGVQNSWNMVPPELLNLIQLHLFGRYHAVFRLVCRAWQHVSSIRDYSIAALLSSTALLELCQSFSSPLLMFQEDLTCDTVPVFRFLDLVHKKLYRTEIPQLRETDIHCSRDGWLLVCRHSDESIFFFNPLTQEKIELPRMDATFCGHYFCLSFSSLPTCSNCLVVGIHRISNVVYTLKHGEETWRKQEVDDYGTELDETEYMREYGHCPVVLNGLHHFMCENRDMIVLNLKDGVEGQFPDVQGWSSKKERCHSGDEFFLEIDGALSFVSVEADGGKKMNIFKWNDLETDWELMEGGVDFGGKAMFLSKRGSFMEKIDDVGELGNTIFLPMIDDAKEGVFYSLATHKYHTFYSGHSSELPYNVDKLLNGIWVKPHRKIVGDGNLKWFDET